MQDFHGGKVYGQGMKGYVSDTACYKNDIHNFCYLFYSKIDSCKVVILYTDSEKVNLKTYGDFNTLYTLLQNAQHTVTKTFNGKDPQMAFRNELRSNITITKIFQNKSHHTISPGFLWNNKPVYGMKIVDNLNNASYHLFSEGCSIQIMHIKFTQPLFNKFVQDITDTLNVLQKFGYQHNDIKPDNMVFCKNSNRFKLIDWELTSHINNSMKNLEGMGNTLFNHPLKFYLSGLPAFVSKRLATFYAAKKKKYNWVSKLKTFHELHLLTTTSFDYILQTHPNDSLNKIHRLYSSYFDKYAFAQSVILLADKNRLQIPFHIVNNLLDPLLPRLPQKKEV